MKGYSADLAVISWNWNRCQAILAKLCLLVLYLLLGNISLLGILSGSIGNFWGLQWLQWHNSSRWKAWLLVRPLPPSLTHPLKANAWHLSQKQTLGTTHLLCTPSLGAPSFSSLHALLRVPVEVMAWASVFVKPHNGSILLEKHGLPASQTPDSIVSHWGAMWGTDTWTWECVQHWGSYSENLVYQTTNHVTQRIWTTSFTGNPYKCSVLISVMML